MPLNELNDVLAAAGSSTNDRRAAVLRENAERTARRRSEIEAQSSPLMNPQERIRLWEKLHEVTLPISRDHKLLRLIAQSTALSLEEIHEEQVRRLGSMRHSPAGANA
jgi:hypothetical protein